MSSPNRSNEANAVIALLRDISEKLDKLVTAAAPASPAYHRPFSDYGRFVWANIGAAVIEHDQHGATVVEWNKHRFIRRTGGGKFGKAVWFSRSLAGSKDDESTSYARLITFKDYAPEPPEIELPAAREPNPIPKPAPVASLTERPTELDNVDTKLPAGVNPDRPYEPETIRSRIRDLLELWTKEEKYMDKETKEDFPLHLGPLGQETPEFLRVSLIDAAGGEAQARTVLGYLFFGVQSIGQITLAEGQALMLVLFNGVKVTRDTKPLDVARLEMAFIVDMLKEAE